MRDEYQFGYSRAKPNRLSSRMKQSVVAGDGADLTLPRRGSSRALTDQSQLVQEFLKTIGRHYEVWRREDGTLYIDVIHSNSSELDRQRGYTPQGCLRRYSQATVS